MAFVVIHFLVTDDVSVASSQWLNSDKTACMWPPYKEVNKVKRCVLEHRSPDSTWISYEVVVLGSYPNYLSAEIKCRKALDTSSINADESDVVGEKNTVFIHPLSESSDAENVSKRARMMHQPTIIFPLIDENGFQHSINKSDDNNCENNKYQLEQLNVPLLGIEPTECEKQILIELNEILKVQEEHSLLLQKLIQPSTSSPTEIDASFIPKLPADTFEEFDDWEVFLHDSSTFKCATKLFAAKVGSDLARSTRRILSDIITNKLASNFSWAGRTGKRGFQNLQTVPLILSALKEHLWFKDVSVRTVENYIKDWLKYAPYRQNRHRGKKNKEEELVVGI